MTIKFNDIMQKFYDDEMLGIKNEDAPANSLFVVELVCHQMQLLRKRKRTCMMEGVKKQKRFLKELVNFVQRGIRHLEKRSKRI